MSGSTCRAEPYWVTLHPMKIRPNGFTLIELLIVVSITAVLAALAVPSFNTMLVKRSVQSAATAFVTDLRFARTEALRRSIAVSMCSLAANSTTTCSGAPANWANGWIVFAETASPPNLGVRDAGEEIIRVQQPPPNIATIQGPIPANDHPFFTFRANGWAIASSEDFTFTPTGVVPVNSTRMVCISNQGRVRLLVEGATGC